VRDASSVRRSAEGCDAAIHLASISAWDKLDSSELVDVVMRGTKNVLEAAKTHRLHRVVNVSTTVALSGSDAPQVFDEEHDAPEPPASLRYAVSKRAAEAMAREFNDAGLPVVTVNPAEVYGPNDVGLVTARNLVDFAKSYPVLVCNGGTAVVHVDDVANGIVAALEKGKPGERYILAGENLTVKQLAALTLEILGRKAPIFTSPNVLMKALAAAGKTLRFPLPFEPALVPYATRYWFVSSAKAQRELGVTFRPPREVLASTLAWLREAKHV
jgi:dihydroflavonol-4-reductase